MAKFRSILPPEDTGRQSQPEYRQTVRRSASHDMAFRKRPEGGGDPIDPRRGRRLKRSVRRKPKRSTGSLIIMGVLIVLIVSMLMTLKDQRDKVAALTAQLQTQNAERKALESSITQLRDELKLVNTNEFIEKYAHENLGMVKPNELIVDKDGKIRMKSKTSSETTASTSDSGESHEGSAASESAPAESTPAEQSASETVSESGQ